jgi:hypothetical protein
LKAARYLTAGTPVPNWREGLEATPVVPYRDGTTA